ncbi:unnamed protein product [Symbiodinium natans]|uniref:Uncharacterized protein n=1 Tax=Symbiodinium natans TaxID=878477 RepID=A0A812RQT6_9DINO|nr:unnamed protein product [Symbiodinium natans]
MALSNRDIHFTSTNVHCPEKASVYTACHASDVCDNICSRMLIAIALFATILPLPRR